jgi:predicted nucleic acid-binding protein
MFQTNLENEPEVQSLSQLIQLEDIYNKFIIQNSEFLIDSNKIEAYLDVRDEIILRINKLKRSKKIYSYDELVKKVQHLENELTHIKQELTNIKKN